MKVLYVAVCCNSTTGPFVVERTTRERLRSSRADFCGPWPTKAQAQLACKLLNAPSEDDEPVLADELLAEHGL